MRKKLTIAGVLTVAALCASAPIAGTAVTHSAMLPSKTGTFVKVDSKTSFTMTAGGKSYVVKTNGMTRFTFDHKTVNESVLKKGDTITVKCPVAYNAASDSASTVS